MIVGLDLGQSADYTALAVLDPQADGYAVRNLTRFDLGTGYPKIVATIADWLTKPPLEKAWLVVDQTGVGRPVVDGFRQTKVGTRTIPVTITGGHTVTGDRTDGFGVPKKELVSTLQLLLGSQRLAIGKSLPNAVVLIKELQAFKVKVSASGNESFEAWRERDHDDLVLAVALAAWFAESQRPFRRLKVF